VRALAVRPAAPPGASAAARLLRAPAAPIVVAPIPPPDSPLATAMPPGFVIAPAAAVALPTLPAVHVVARAPRPLAPAPITAMSAVASARLTAAERRAAREAKARADSVARVAPLEHVLRRYSSNRTLTRRIAAAVSREARRSRVEPALVVAVLVAENNVLKPHARNRHTSAAGLMQVMPRWAGRLGCASSDLTDVDSNICHGVRVLALHLREARGDLHHGLQRFNGCRRTEGSTRCDVYPNRVLAHAERLEGQMETYAKRQQARTGSTGR
jgi:soluble lytic murein transglycosylase-like protein